jgi:hypothetical protein
MPDFSAYRFGLLDATPHPETRLFASRPTRARRQKAEIDLHAAMNLDLDHPDPLGNARRNNCVPAGLCQLTRCRRSNAMGDQWRPKEADAIEAYSAMTGFNPITGRPDVGTRLDTGQTYMAQHGIDVGFDMSVASSLAVDHRSLDALMIGAELCLGLGLCLAMPLAWDGLSFWRLPADLSDPRARPGSAGLHFTMSGKYHDNGAAWSILTWGIEVLCTAPALMHYLVAAIAFEGSDAIDARTGLTPSGISREELAAEMQRFALA